MWSGLPGDEIKCCDNDRGSRVARRRAPSVTGVLVTTVDIGSPEETSHHYQRSDDRKDDRDSGDGAHNHSGTPNPESPHLPLVERTLQRAPALIEGRPSPSRRVQGPESVRQASVPCAPC